jgi:hypothetical protein
VFLRGPGYAYDIVTDLDRVERPVAAAAGFVLDVDTRRVVVFDAAIRWSAEEAEDPSAPPPLGTALRAADLASLDLYPEERALVDVARRGTTKEALVEGLHAVELRDSYRGWSIEWAPTHAALVEASRALTPSDASAPPAVATTSQPQTTAPAATAPNAPASWTPTGVPFVDERVANNDLVLCRIVQRVGPQALRAVIEQTRRVGQKLPLQPGMALDFVHAPGTWGAVPLQVGDRALLFVRLVQDDVYEESHHGHWILMPHNGEDLAVLPLDPSHLERSELAPLRRPVPARSGISGLALAPLSARLGLA